MIYQFYLLHIRVHTTTLVVLLCTIYQYTVLIKTSFFILNDS